MAESKTVEGVTWLTSRPGVLALLKGVKVREDVFVCTFGGTTEQEFIAAGVASLELFQSVGKSKTRSGSDEYGDRFTLRRCRGAWQLTRRLGEGPQYACPTDENERLRPYGKKYGPALEAEMVSILERFARPRY